MARPLLFIILTSSLITGQYFPQYAHQQQYYQLPNQQQQTFQQFPQTVHQPQQYNYNSMIQQKPQVVYQNNFQNSGLQQYDKVFHPPPPPQQQMIPSIQNYRPTQIIKNPQPYQSQYQPQVFQYQHQQSQQFQLQPQSQYPKQFPSQQQSYSNTAMRQNSMPQAVQYNLPPNQQQQQQQYAMQNENVNIFNRAPIEVSSDSIVVGKLSQQQYDNTQQPQYNQNIPTISAPIYRSNTVVKVVEKVSSPQFQGQTYTQEGSFDSADVPPPPPPEKFLPEKTYIPKTRVASETKVTNYVPTNFHAQDELRDIPNRNVEIIKTNINNEFSKSQILDENSKKDIVRTTTPQQPVNNFLKQSNIEKNIERENVAKINQVSHLSPSKSSTAVNDVFLKCCHKKNVSPKCESRCNFDIINKKILTAMFLGSDPCPQSYGRDLFSCAAQDGDHTDCCRKMNVTRTTAGEKCLAFCKMTPDTHFQADVTYLPCWSVLNDIKQCFKNAIIDSL